jgi:hypothetical protein
MPSRPAVLATTALVAAAAIGVAVYRDRRN